MSKPSASGNASAAAPGRGSKRSLWPLYAVLFITIAPIIAAVVLYLNPQWLDAEATNYGTILDPQRPVPEPAVLTLTDLEGKPVDLRDERGQWLLLSADEAACPDECARKLFIMRQTHASTGKNVTRIERVWFILDDAPVPDKVLEAYKGTHMLRANAEQLQQFLGPVDLKQHIWIIDPLNNLMMRFPEDPDPIRLRKDLGRLLFASQIG